MTSVPPFSPHPGPPPSRPELPEGVAARAPERSPDGLPPLHVPLWAPFAALLVAFIGVLLLGLIAELGVVVAGGEVDPDSIPPGLTLALTAVQGVGLIVAAWYAVELFGRGAVPASFGLRVPRPLPALGWTIVAYLGFLVASAILITAFGQPDEQQLVQDIQEEDSFAVVAGFAVLSCLVAPIAEEFFFRGFLFRALAERVHWSWAAIVAGGVFGLVHAPGSPAVSLLALSIFGVALCLLLLRTGSLIPCIMLHALNNSISFGDAKGLPWWGFLLLIAGSVGTTLAVSLLAARLGRRTASPAAA